MSVTAPARIMRLTPAARLAIGPFSARRRIVDHLRQPAGVGRCQDPAAKVRSPSRRLRRLRGSPGPCRALGHAKQETQKQRRSSTQRERRQARCALCCVCSCAVRPETAVVIGTDTFEVKDSSPPSTRRSGQRPDRTSLRCMRAGSTAPTGWYMRRSVLQPQHRRSDTCPGRAGKQGRARRRRSGQPTRFFPGGISGSLPFRFPRVPRTRPCGRSRCKAVPWPSRRASISSTLIEPFKEMGGSNPGNAPPTLRFASDGPPAQGPAGMVVSRTAKVGVPLPLDVWLVDDGLPPPRPRPGNPPRAEAGDRVHRRRRQWPELRQPCLGCRSPGANVVAPERLRSQTQRRRWRREKPAQRRPSRSRRGHAAGARIGRVYTFGAVLLDQRIRQGDRGRRSVMCARRRPGCEAAGV